MNRFWSKVDVRGADECWLWQAGTGGRGYGQFHFDGRATTAHRVAYLLEVGEIPSGMDLHHSCEEKLCCNPAHLALLAHGEHTRHHAPRLGTGAPDCPRCGGPKNARRRCLPCGREYARWYHHEVRKPRKAVI